MMMNVISRVVGTHRLLLLNFYPFIQRYMQVRFACMHNVRETIEVLFLAAKLRDHDHVFVVQAQLNELN